MMDDKRTSPRLKRTHGKKRRNRHLLVIDDRPIRKRAILQCRRMINRYRYLFSEVERFERTDKPLFTQWFNASFGVELTRIRELKDENRKLEELIKLVNLVKYSKNTSYSKAYVIACEFKDGFDPYDFNPDDSDERMFFEENEHDGGYWYDDSAGWYEFDDDVSFETDDEDVHIDEEEFLKDIFIDTLRDIPGYEKIITDEAEFERMFTEFRRSFSEAPREEGYENNKSDSQNAARDTDKIKSLYRRLAQQLHPDSGDGFDREKAETWYRVQEAYRAGNIAELEMLSVHIRIGDGDFPSNCPVSHIRSVFADYGEKVNRLKELLRNYRKDHAWDFEHKNDDDKALLARTIRRDLDDIIRIESNDYVRFSRLVERWAGGGFDRCGLKKRRTTEIVDPAQLELTFSFD
jgi:hypothetical protein